jgi:hypothetical protein
MKYKLATAVVDHRGKPMVEGDGTLAVNLTLGLVLERACLFGGEQDAKADAKFRQFKLAQRIAKNSDITSDPVEFSAGEVEQLKKLCSQVYTPVAYGAVCEMLENPAPTDALPTDVAAVIGAGGTE